MKLEKEVKIHELTANKIEYRKNNNVFMNVEFLNLLNDLELSKLLAIRNNGKVRLTLETEEPILDDAEKRYLSGVIRPFRNKIECIVKDSYNQKYEFIIIKMKREANIILPNFKTNTMYKNMVINKEYSLDDLDL